MFVNLAILIIFFFIPWDNPDICWWIYPKKAFNDGNHLPIFLILSSSNPASFISHAPPTRFKCVSILSSGIFLLGYPIFSATNFIWNLISLSVTLPLTTLSQYAHKSIVPSDVCNWICATRCASAFTGNSNICPSNAPWCTHATLCMFFFLVMCYVATTTDNRSCFIALRVRG